MKKVLALILAATLIIGVAACASSDPEPEGPAVKRVAAIMNQVGVNPFLTQVVEELAAIHASGRFPMEYTVIECVDIPAFGENIRAAVEEGFDLIISVGFQGADAIAEISQAFPDRAQYVIIDVVADSPYVKSITFKPAEASYMIGIIAAMVSANPFLCETGLSWFCCRGGGKRHGFLFAESLQSLT